MSAEPTFGSGSKVSLQIDDDGVAFITLSRPLAGNALDAELCQALRTAMEEAAGARPARCIVLRSEGRAFCVGGDLAAFEAAGEARPSLVRRMAEDLHAGQAALRDGGAPVLAMVQGVAAGAGVGLALCADLVLAAQSASFTLAYGAVGLSLDGGASYLLPRLIGPRRTAELSLTNRTLTADEAVTWGLITATVADDRLVSEGLSLARRLAALPRDATAGVKRLLDVSLRNDFRAQTALETDLIATVAGGADAAEGIRAFREKRPPRFGAR